MSKFIVRRIVDAYAVYEAEVEARSPSEAANLAYLTEEDYIWSDLPDIQTFDARYFVTLDDNGDPIEITKVGDL